VTTIAYRDGVMAGDSGSTSGETVDGSYRKTFKHEGRLYGMTGRVADAAVFKEWVKKGRKGKPGISDLQVIEIRADGKVLFWEGDRPPFIYKSPCVAIGTGSDIALGAMLVGANAKQALKAARKANVYTIGKIRTIKLKKR